MQTVLITGGAGFIGHHVVKELISQNYKVIIIDNFSNSNEDFAKQLGRNGSLLESIHVYKEDIRNGKAVSNIFGVEKIDACIHLAAKISVSESISKPFETIDVNVTGTLNILQACSDNNIKNFVFASTAAVYGHPKTLPISEWHLPQPVSPYGASKLAGEALVSSFRKRITNYKILRLFNVYGMGQTSAYAGVMSKFINRLSHKLPPIIYGKGNQTRDFIHVSDVVRAVLLAVEKKQIVTGSNNDGITVNIGTGRQTSVRKLAHLFIELFGLRGKLRPLYRAPTPGDILFSYANIKRAKKVLKFSAKDYLNSKSLGELLLLD